MIHDPILRSTIPPTFNDPMWDPNFDNHAYDDHHYYVYFSACKKMWVNLQSTQSTQILFLIQT